MKKVSYLWKIWAKSLGEKAGDSDRDADRVAIIRTALIMVAMLANASILAVNIPKIIHAFLR